LEPGKKILALPGMLLKTEQRTMENINNSMSTDTKIFHINRHLPFKHLCCTTIQYNVAFNSCINDLRRETHNMAKINIQVSGT